MPSVSDLLEQAEDIEYEGRKMFNRLIRNASSVDSDSSSSHSSSGSSSSSESGDEDFDNREDSLLVKTQGKSFKAARKARLLVNQASYESDDESRDKAIISEECSEDMSCHGSDDGSYSVGASSQAANSVARAIHHARKSGASRLAAQASLAMMRRMKESHEMRSSLEAIKEVNYDDGATLLYKHIENSRWKEASELCELKPSEVRTWVFRMDKKKQILWRMLPIHTAVLYRAPVEIIGDLLRAYPDGSKQVDYKKMLPLHMACRVLSKEETLKKLLHSNPDAIFSKDSKGRVPKALLSVDSVNVHESKVLQKVNARHRKNLLKILEKYEASLKRLKNSSSTSVASSRMSRSRDNRSTISKRRDDGSIAESSKINSNIPKGDQSIRSSRSRSRSISRAHSKDNRNSVARNVDPISRNAIPRSPRKGNDMLPPTGRNALPRRESRSSEQRTNAGERSISRTRERSVSRQRSNSNESLDDRSTSSKSRNAPRNSITYDQHHDDVSVLSMEESNDEYYEDDYDNDEEDDDDASKFSGLFTSSRAITGKRSTVSLASRRSRSRSTLRVERKPRHLVTEPEDLAEKDECPIDEITGDPLNSLWKEIQSIYPCNDNIIIIPPIEKESNDSAFHLNDNLSDVKFFDPSKELQKLMSVISFENEDPDSTSLSPRTASAATRRTNACGALRALSKNSKNRMRLGRTKGVISCLLRVISDNFASDEERFRCINTLTFLCVSKQNLEAIFHADPSLLSVLSKAFDDSDSRVRYNSTTCIFLLSKSEQNRKIISKREDLLDSLVQIAYLEDEVEPSDDDVSLDRSIHQQHSSKNGGSQNGIKEQAPKRGCRLNVLKVFMNLSKDQYGAQALARNQNFLSFISSLTVSMTEEELTLCLELVSNISSDYHNIQQLRSIDNLLELLSSGMRSQENESRKPAVLSVQYLSCDHSYRRLIGANSDILESLSIHALSRNETENTELNETKMSAIHALKNLCIEPCNLMNITDTPGLVAGMILAVVEELDTGRQADGEEKIDKIAAPDVVDDIYRRKMELMKYSAADGLAALSLWMSAVSDRCIQTNSIPLDGRSLASMKVTGWNIWD